MGRSRDRAGMRAEADQRRPVPKALAAELADV